MGKSYRGDKEANEIQRLKYENKKLRTQISKLRKVINNIDIQHYQFVTDLLNSEAFMDNTAEELTQRKLEKQWSCYHCESGVMRLMILHRAGEPYYMRKCDCCDNKTKIKKYREDVKGV